MNNKKRRNWKSIFFQKSEYQSICACCKPESESLNIYSILAHKTSPCIIVIIFRAPFLSTFNINSSLPRSILSHHGSSGCTKKTSRDSVLLLSDRSNFLAHNCTLERTPHVNVSHTHHHGVRTTITSRSPATSASWPRPRRCPSPRPCPPPPPPWARRRS